MAADDVEGASIMGWRRRSLLSAVGGAHFASTLLPLARFIRATRDPERAQRARLRAFLQHASASQRGQGLGLTGEESAEAFQRKVPVVDYEDLRPSIERIAAGEVNILSTAPVKCFEPSSGTTGGEKLIPYTQPLLDEFSAATNAWIGGMLARHPRLVGTRSYWSVSPAARLQRTTSAGIRIGFEDDTEYFGPVTRWALERLMSVPGTLARIEDVGAWRTETARLLLADRNLGLISVWNPTFLTILFDGLLADFEDLVRTLPAARRREVLTSVDGAGAVTPRALWPRLRLISCWTDAHAARLLPRLEQRFEGIAIEGKGLLATEGVISIPFASPTSQGVTDQRVVAIDSHFLEFIPEDAPHERPRFAWQLEEGRRYEPLLTTGNGFARYRLYDTVECTGFLGRTPCLRFDCKAGRISDLCGEKLTDAEVSRSVMSVGAAEGCRPSFVLVAPTFIPAPGYTVFVEGVDDVASFAAALDARLCENPHYRYCRDLGQLRPMHGIAVRDGARAFERTKVARGARIGDLKPATFDVEAIWDEVFSVPS